MTFYPHSPGVFSLYIKHMTILPLLLACVLSAAEPAVPAPLKIEILTTTPDSRWISPDASMSAVRGESAITVWSLAAGKPLFRIEAPETDRVGPNDHVVFEPVSFSNDGRWLLAKIDHRRSKADRYYSGNKVQFVLVSVTEEKIVRTLASFEGPCVTGRGITQRCLEIRSAEFSADGRKVVVFGEKNLTGGDRYEDFVIGLDLEGRKLISEIQLMRASNSEPVRPNRLFQQFKGYDLDGRMLGIAADEGSCALMDLTASKRLAFLDGCSVGSNPALNFAYGYSYSWTAKSGGLRVWNLDGTLRGEISVAPETNNDLVFLSLMSDGRYAFESRKNYSNNTLVMTLWDVQAGRKVATSSDAVFDRGFSARLTPDRRHVAMNVAGKTVYARLNAGVPLTPSVSASVAVVDASIVADAPVAVVPARAAPVRNFDAPPASASKTDPDAYAVIIGIEKYRAAGIPRVDYAARDAKTMYDYATAAMGFDAKNVILLTDDQATKTDFEKNLGSWLKNRVGAKSRVLVYYAGHGSPNPSTGDGYLMPYEADPNYLEDTAYPVTKLYAALSKLPTKDVIVILDACFSGQGGRSLIAKGARPLVSVVTAKAATNTVVLAASESSQISASNPERRHGLLTSYLLEGLSGAADADGDGKIFSAEIFAFVRPAVERAARLQNIEQTPTMTPSLEVLKAAPGRPWIELPVKK